MRKRITVTIICIIAAGLIIAHQGQIREKLYRDKRVALGTFVEVVSSDNRAAGIVFDEISRIELLLSKYDPRSEISRLNKSGRLKVSPDTFLIIKKSKELNLITNGAFDITIAPLMDLWGFSNRAYTLPSEEKIKGTLKLVGSDKIILREIESVVEFKVPGMKIDLGGIAKGYAIDCAVKKLKSAKVKGCLINAGGQVYCLGDRSGRHWKVALRDPLNPKGIIEYLPLKDKGISVSGCYEQNFLKENRRYCHILNPRSGYPVESKALSVSVISQNATLADALSTAIFVMGENEWQRIKGGFKDVEAKTISIDE